MRLFSRAHSRSRSTPAPAPLLAMVAVALAACGGAAAGGGTTGSGGGPTGGRPSGVVSAGDSTSNVPGGLKFERTADFSLQVGHGGFDRSLDSIFALMAQEKGYAAGSSVRGDPGGLRNGSVSIKVPSESFQDTIDRLRRLGTVTSFDLHGDDVTSQYVDLSARLRNLQAQEAAMVALFGKATSVQDTINVQNQLAGIREQIERLQGQINLIDHTVAFSTVNITVLEAGVGVSPGGDDWGFKTALSQAAHYAVGTVDVLVVILGASLPILLVALPLGLFLRRRLARPRQMTPTA